MASAALELLIQLKDEASGPLSAITGSLGGMGKAALTVAGGGLLAIGGGLTAAIGAGLSFNNSMEQVSAQLMAFTKDGAQTAAILDMIKERAASTPFAFEDMATAATALLPASKAAGVGLEDLIAQAEILAASNPAEGLEGAAFALKEAVGGDFQSAIERFNLPRQYINQLKEEGVPNLEILSQAMGQLGLDADLVAGLAGTASGRWSTFLDTLTNVAAAVSQPIFEAFSSGLAGVQTVLDANMPAITAFAGVLAGQLASAIQWLIATGVPMLIAGWAGLQPALDSAGAALMLVAGFFAQLWTAVQPLIPSLQGAGAALMLVAGFFAQLWTAVQPLIPSLQGALMPALVGLAAVIGGGIVVALGSMIAAFVAAAAPIVALVAVAGALYAAWSSNFLGLRDIVTGALSAVVSVVMSVAGQIVAFWQANGAQIIATATAAWGQLQAIVSGALQIVMAVVQTVLGAVVSFIQAHGATIQAVFSAVWGALSAIVSSALNIIQGIIRTVLAVIRGDWAGAWEGLKATVVSVFAGLGAIVKAGLTLIGASLRLILTIIADVGKGLMNAAIELGRNIISGVISGVKAAGGALLDAMKSMASSALNAAKAALGIASPSRVMAAEVGAPIVDGIVAGLVQRSPKAVQAMLDLASSMFDVVSKGVEAFGKLTQLGNIPQSAIANFGDAIMRTLTEFSARVGQWDKAAMSAASQFTYKAGQVVDFLAKGVELLNGIAALAVPSRDAIRAFADALAMVMSEIVRVSTFELRLGLTAGVEFASGAKAIAEMIGTGVEALNALSDFVKPAPGVIQKFVDTIGWLVSRFVLVGEWFDGQALGAAQVFAQAAGQVFTVVAEGVDALIRLGEFVKPAPGVIQSFATTIWWLVAKFAEVGGWMSGPALTAATTFADAAGKVLGVIMAGVDGLLKLAEFVKPAPGVIQAFATTVWWLVNRFAEVASWMGTRAIAAAAAFAESAGKAVGVIGAAVDALGKLSTFVAPLEENVSAFFRSLADFLEKMGSWSANFEADMLAATGAFAEGIGKSVAGLGAAVDVLGKLVNFVAPAEANVSAFLRGMADMLEKMGSMAYYFEADMLAATAALAEGIGKSVAGLGTAVDLLSKLVDFVAPAEANVSAFLRGLADLLEKMGSMAYYFEEDMLAVTGALSAGIGKSVAGLGAAVDALGKLVDFVAPAEANVSAFFRSLADLLEKMGSWSANFEADMFETTAAFAAGVQKSVAGIGAAADALGKLVEFEAPAGKHISAFFGALANLLAQMKTQAAAFDVSLFETTTAFAAGVNSSIAPLKGAIESLGKFVDFVPPAQKGVSAFFQSVGALLTQMGTLAAQYSAEFFAGTILFGQNVSKAVATIKAAFDEFASLADLKGLAAGVLTSFSNNLARLLDELGAMVVPAAENIGAALVYGIADGINAQLPYLVATLQNAAYTMVDTVQTALGIASPSKVFEQIGQYAGEGMAGGMAAMQPAIAGAGTGLGMAAAGGASGAASAGRGGGGEGLTVNIAAGAITLSGVSGQVGEKELRRLAQLIKEEFANERGGR